jgi:hypothetical protein
MSARSRVTLAPETAPEKSDKRELFKDREKCIESGASGCVAKPVHLDPFFSPMRVRTHDRPHRKVLRASMAV